MTWLRSWCMQWVFTGLLLGVGFVVPFLWPLGLGGGAYFLFLLQQKSSLRQRVFGAWTAWTIKSAFSVGWFWSTYPIEWLPLDFGQIQIPLLFFSWFMTAVCLGSGAVVLVLIVELLRKQTDLKPWAYYILIYPLLWIIGESLGSLAFSAFWYGPGGTLNTSFSFGYVGYLLAGHEVLLQVARLAGVFSLSYLFVLLVGVVLWVSQQSKRVQYAGVTALIVVYLVGLIPVLKMVTDNPTTGYKVIVVDTEMGSRLHDTKEGDGEIRVALAEAAAIALSEEPDYVVFPEDSRFFDQSRPASSVKSLFKVQYNDPQIVLIDSSRATYGGETVQQAFVYNGPEDSTERFHKRYLVPQGEFFPSIYSYIFKRSGFGESLEYLSQSISYRVGPWTDQGRASANVPGILFCFESFAPQGVRQLTRERADMPFVVHIASHAWFHEPYTLWSQMESMMRVQAVWNQQYLVSAGNMMSGKLYAPKGSIIEMDTIAKGELWELKQTVIPK